MKIQSRTHLTGHYTVPGDKSISHRSIMFGAIATGTTYIHNFLTGADCYSTMGCFRSMGITITEDFQYIKVIGKGLHGLSKPCTVLDVGNSGTTTRLLSGILAGQSFSSTMSGDASLNSRPMKRIQDPLQAMGANIESINHDHCAPLRIQPGTLHGMVYHSPVASAQVKSSILLAGLYANSPTTVIEPILSRNHTELMLEQYGANIITEDTTITIQPAKELYAQEIIVPGDISSAAYYIAAALMVPHSQILISNVGINPTRAGFLQVCKEMGGNITFENIRTSGGEPVADLVVSTSDLHGIEIGGSIIPTLIDEIPIISILAAYANGTTTIRNAAELKVKESNRINTVAVNLRAMGAPVETTPDGLIIEGGTPLSGSEIHSFHDHRIAMSFAIAGLIATGETEILNSECVDISFPGFWSSKLFV